MALSGAQFTIAAGEFEVTVVEVGAALRGYTQRGADVTVPFDEDSLPPRCCGAVLVPWPNRLRGGRYSFDGVDYQVALTEPVLGNALHGLARWVRWTPALHEPTRVTLTHDIVPQKGYPFEIRVDVTYALHPELGLSVSMSAHNTGTRRAPFGAGCHPYFSTRGVRLADTKVVLPAAQRLLVDDAQVPIGAQSVEGTPYDLRKPHRLKTLRMDDGFTGLRVTRGRGTAEVHFGEVGARLWFDDVFGYLQVFTPDDMGDGRPGVAIEPMTCAPDAFNSGDGLLVLAPGTSWSGSWGITPF